MNAKTDSLRSAQWRRCASVAGSRQQRSELGLAAEGTQAHLGGQPLDRLAGAFARYAVAPLAIGSLPRGGAP